MTEAELNILQLGPQGDGIHDDSRGRVYVDRAMPGDRIRARVRTDDKGLFRGELVRVVEPSPERRPAPCPHYDRCGNCTLQHTSENFYREWKQGVVRDAFRRQGVHPLSYLEPIFLGAGLRRRATFSASRRGSSVVLGYYRRRSREITDIRSCLVIDPRLVQLRQAIQPFFGNIVREGRTVDVLVQLVGESVDVLITGPVGKHGELDTAAHAAIALLSGVPPIVRVAWRAADGEPIEVIAESGALVAQFGPLKVSLPPAAFLQPTLAGEHSLVDAVMNALPESGKFADLFAGCGTFSGPLVARGPVDAFDAISSSVKALAAAAGDRPLQAIRRDLVRNPVQAGQLAKYDAVVFDPPRAGAPEQAQELAASKVPSVVGLSCNPATFARDARILNQGGYRLKSVQLVDQFVWSHHVEVVGVFQRRKQ